MKRPEQADNLIKVGVLHEEKHSPEEVASHMSLAEGFLQAAKTQSLSLNVRYLNAYDAVHQVATAALRAMNLRSSNRAGARDRAIQSLAWTLNIRSELMPVLIQSNKNRGAIVYSPTDAGAVSAQELSALIAALEQILGVARRALAASLA